MPQTLAYFQAAEFYEGTVVFSLGYVESNLSVEVLRCVNNSDRNVVATIYKNEQLVTQATFPSHQTLELNLPRNAVTILPADGGGFEVQTGFRYTF